jgi:type IV secretion system protein VirD4
LLTHVLLAPEYAGERNLRGLRKLIATPKKTLQELLTRMYNEASSAFVKETVGVFITMPEDTFSSVHSTAAKDTQWLSVPEYATLVCGNTFKATDIAQGAIDVFLNLSTETVKTDPGLARVIVGALINALMQANGAHKERVLFLLDEVNLLGTMQTLETARDEGRKYGVMLMMGICCKFVRRVRIG